ncbi:hypothetical protein [Streptomyces sp. PanSC9]|uniref:hypothetical protein n=1 Tax=Streptomyces sp. PanSC9 TaxID=1520461 RepID=UPI000F9DB68A|nr:hypothetical protein [Streptomyces sp. PanSC9]ROP51007.1 hypothetical protein EDD94_0419 [Streptomyces sp. PanSC9]
MTTKLVEGANILKHFVPDPVALREQDPFTLILQTGIWLPLEAYAEWPIMLPWSVRDLSCRSAGGVRRELWSSPDQRGYCLDDNSFIKGTARSLSVVAPEGHPLAGAKMARGFTAAHIWREVGQPVLASRIPLLYSFIPNLVWLPNAVAKLTDYEGQAFQRAAQRISVALFRNAPVAPPLQRVADEAWEMIGAQAQPDPDTQEKIERIGVNWFTASAAFYRTRRKRVDEILSALRAIECGEPIRKKVVSSRYTIGLPNVAPPARVELYGWLQRFQG